MYQNLVRAKNIFRRISILVISFLFIFPNYLNPQEASASTLSYSYTNSFEEGSVVEIQGMVLDSQNNIYYTGVFSNTVNFDLTGGTDNHNSNGGSDSFLTKINSDGTYGYTYTFGGNLEDAAYSVDVDNQNNIYIVGLFFSSAVDFDPTSGTDNRSPASAYNDSFLTKINSDGTYGYTYTFGGTVFTDMFRIKIDNINNIYILGEFIGESDFDPTGGTDNHTSNGYVVQDVSLTKINSDGTYGYTYTFGSTGLEYAEDLTTDSQNNVYLVGRFSSTVDFDPTSGADNHSLVGGTGDGYFTKINSDGTYGYTYTFGGANYEIVYSIVSDSQDNMYIFGEFSSANIDLDPTSGVDNFSTSGNADIFLTKINSSGSYQYTYTYGGTGWDSSYGITVDFEDNIYLQGMFTGEIDFDPTLGVDNYTAPGTPDSDDFATFFTRIDSDGSYNYTYINIVGVQNDNGYDFYPSGIKTDSDNNVLISGIYNGKVNLNPFGEYIRESNSYTSFLSKYLAEPASNDPSISVSVNTNTSSSASAPVCTDFKPSSSPDLFQIDVSYNSATVFFTPVNSNTDKYFISYGFSENDERFGVEFKGVLSYTIQSLEPKTKYYFRIRAGNGCKTGEWSNTLGVKTQTNKNNKINHFYTYF